MGTLVSKANKGRSPASQKLRAKKGKKAASKKPQRPGKIAKPAKVKKAVSVKTRKQPSPAKKPASTIKKKGVKAAPSRTVKAATRKSGPVSKSKQAVAKATPSPKKSQTPSSLAAVHAFEQALKVFNRHDFTSARSGFESILEKYGDQHEVVARARTYLAICEQRLARAPSVPRNTDALYDQGVFELNKGNIRKAIELFDKALKAEPRADHVLYSLAAAYSRLNEPQKALDALRRAISFRTVHRSHARRDLDFAGMHSNEEFQHLTGFGFDITEE